MRHLTVIRNIRLHALLFALSYPIPDEPPSLPQWKFRGNQRRGVWRRNLAERGDYVLEYDVTRGVVGLQYESYRDADGQGQRPWGDYTPEIYLRHPERSVNGGVPVPASLVALAEDVEVEKPGPCSGGMWVSADALHYSGFDPGWFTPYLSQRPREAVFERFEANCSQQESWAMAGPFRSEIIEEALLMVELPWAEKPSRVPRDTAARLAQALRRHYRSLEPREARKLKPQLRALGFSWPFTADD